MLRPHILAPRPGVARRIRQRSKTLRPVRPNAGIEAEYRKRLVRMLTDIHKSTVWWISAEYRKHPPATLAMDASPFTWLLRVLRKLRDRWMSKIEEAAPLVAAHFDQAVADRSDTALKKILRDAGMTVRFQETPAMRDIRAASVAENVSLIKSIPEKYFTEIEGIVSRGYSNGYDLKTVTDELHRRFDISRRRAAFIAKDQSSKLHSQLTRIRSLENGITRAKWLHSHGGKSPRKSHLHVMNGQEFDLAEGLYDPDPRVRRKIQPGTLIGCKCVYRPIVAGFS